MCDNCCKLPAVCVCQELWNLVAGDKIIAAIRSNFLDHSVVLLLYFTHQMRPTSEAAFTIICVLVLVQVWVIHLSRLFMVAGASKHL